MANRNSELTVRTLAGFKWSYASIFVQGVVQLGVLSVLARKLTPLDFGIFGIATLFTSSLERVGYLGVAPALVQRDELSDTDKRVAMSLSLLLGAGLSLGLYLAAPGIGSFFNEPAVIPIVRALSIIFVIEAFGFGNCATMGEDFFFAGDFWIHNLLSK